MKAHRGMMITITDVRRAGYCAGVKTRRWFEGYGFNYRDVIKNGVKAKDFLATGDAMAERVVKAKIDRDGLAKVSSKLIITAEDVRTSRKCMAGAREFAALHDIDYAAFLADGIPARDLIMSGDPDAVAIVRDRLARG